MHTAKVHHNLLIQVWEMYRFRNGQDRQLNIDFAYGGRLLGQQAYSSGVEISCLVYQRADATCYCQHCRS